MKLHEQYIAIQKSQAGLCNISLTDTENSL